MAIAPLFRQFEFVVEDAEWQWKVFPDLLLLLIARAKIIGMMHITEATVLKVCLHWPQYIIDVIQMFWEITHHLLVQLIHMLGAFLLFEFLLKNVVLSQKKNLY